MGLYILSLLRRELTTQALCKLHDLGLTHSCHWLRLKSVLARGFNCRGFWGSSIPVTAMVCCIATGNLAGCECGQFLLGCLELVLCTLLTTMERYVHCCYVEKK